MSNKRLFQSLRATTQRFLSSRLLPAVTACVSTLLALQVHAAVSFPDAPLQTGAAYPPANVMFILDDSGSMRWDYMPDALPTVTGENIARRATEINPLWYDPTDTYQAWTQENGSRFTDGTAFDAAFSDDNLRASPVDLSQMNMTFYTLKAGGTRTQASSYYRYRFKKDGTIEKSKYVSTNSWNQIDQVANISKTRNTWYDIPNAITANDVHQLVISLAGSNGDADLYVRRGARPTSTNYDCTSQSSSSNEQCVFMDADGTYYVAINAYASYTSLTYTASGRQYWTPDSTAPAPSARTAAEERTNYATWYSYHRTRMKSAKAGASEAFAQLSSNLRVGYDSIWQRLGTSTQAGIAYPIPVANNGGLFSGTNKSTWFSNLFAASGNNGTPLQGALSRTGEYFKDVAASGPWGPETGTSQKSCRQNFAILTTDGYWNAAFDSSTVGDADGTAGPAITGPKGASYSYLPEKPFIDNFAGTTTTKAGTLADVAMYYWKNDLVSALTNNVPSTVKDPAFWQHMVTFGISIGQQGTLNPATDLPSITNGTKRWPDPTDAEDAERIDDLWHATVNGHGDFVAATNPKEFAKALLAALRTVAERTGSASNVSANSTTFRTDTRVYQAKYVSGKWVGELSAFDATAAGVADDPAWSASAGIPTSGRKIFTYDGSTGATFPTSAQTSALDRSSALIPVTGANNALYIAGARNLETKNGGTLRDRDAVLGDIVNSSPIYVRDNNTLFVGANDGMMHAIDAANGRELFAYVPGAVSMSDLATLSDPNYTHKFFVDGPISVSTRAQTAGKNILVGTLGRGGKGIYALDVTTPSTFGISGVQWEYNSGDIGQVLGEPLITKLNNGKDVVIVGNGINSSTGRAMLMIFDLANGSLLRTFDTGVGSDNGMFAPRGWDDNGDGKVDYVYAGDLKGNVWRYDLTSSSLSSGTQLKMFTATNASGTAQPITAGIGLAQDPATGNRWVFIGTGRFLSDTDVANTDVQSMYGLIDNGTAISSRTALAARSISIVEDVGGQSLRSFEAASPLPANKRGWYVDFTQPKAGERIVSNPRVRGSVLLTASIIPPTANSCDAGGSGYVNAIDAFTGTSIQNGYFDLDGDGDASDDKTSGGLPVGSVDMGVGMPTLPTVIDRLLVVGGSTGEMAQRKITPPGASRRRVSWREIQKD